MNKKLLIKNIQGATTEEEQLEVMKWISRDERNKSYYITLMNLIVSMDMVTEKHHIYSEKDVADKLQDLKAKISAKENSSMHPAENQKEKENNEKHITQLPIKDKKTKYFLYTAIAASILLVISVTINLYQFQAKTSEPQIAAVVEKPRQEVINTFYTEKGVKGKIKLEDSTIVWLNSDSKIIYPEHFSNDSRQIKFEGEGFFEVAKNANWPMVITTTKGMTVRVLGTKFHIKSYNNDDSEEATLFSGKIQLAKEVKGEEGKTEQRTIEMLPNEIVIFNKNSVKLISHDVDTTKKVAWKRGELLFEDTPMSEVIKMLERWHGAKIIVMDNSVLKHRYNASFDSESLVQILELLKFTSPVDYNYNIVNNTVYLKTR